MTGESYDIGLLEENWKGGEMKEDGLRKRLSNREWASVIEAQLKSGQVASLYCREHDIPYESFLRHRRKRKTEGVKSNRSASASAFVPVRVSSASQSHVVLRMSSGVILECDQLPDVNWLIELAGRLSGEERTTC